jgi:hypothetical protein
VASPRLCCEGPAEGIREAAHAVDGRAREEREDTAFVTGVCRESILEVGCAQLSWTCRRPARLRLKLRDIRYNESLIGWWRLKLLGAVVP